MRRYATKTKEQKLLDQAHTEARAELMRMGIVPRKDDDSGLRGWYRGQEFLGTNSIQVLRDLEQENVS